MSQSLSLLQNRSGLTDRDIPSLYLWHLCGWLARQAGRAGRSWLHHYVYHTRNQAKTDTFFYVESFYNRRRRHSALDYVSPESYEQLYYQQERIFA